MAENTKIEWCDHTFNPWEGCQKVGPGCDHCYAEARDQRFTGGQHWGPGAPRRRTSPAARLQPLRWNRAAEKAGRRARVFCASLADVFDNAVPTEWRDDLWALISATPHLDWLLLTKRPGNIAAMLPPSGGKGWHNVWLGCTVVNQAEADRDIPKLLAVPAAVRFLSMEPLLGPVDLEPWLPWPCGGDDLPDGRPFGCYECEIGDCQNCPKIRAHYWCEEGPRGDDGCPAWIAHGRTTLDWVIVGGESGPNARPMHPDWARSIRDQCQAAEVPFLFKQWGEWETSLDRDRDDPDWRADYSRNYVDRGKSRWLNLAGGQGFHGDRFHVMRRVGKRAAGRLLDGREWTEFPNAEATP